MLRNVLLSVVLLCAATTTDRLRAKEESELELAVQLLALMDMDQMMTSMHQQFETMFDEQIKQFTTCEAMRPAIQAYSREMADLASTSLSANDFMPEVAQVYVDVFTEDELQELLAFYQSPLGQKMLEKMPELMQRSMTIAQQQMTTIMPQIQAAAERFSKEMMASASQCDSDDNDE